MNALGFITLALLVVTMGVLIVLAAQYDKVKREMVHHRQQHGLWKEKAQDDAETLAATRKNLEELQQKYAALEKDPWVDLPRGHKGNKGKFAPRKKSENQNDKK